ncbi:MAG: aminoacyl-tRNA deacylase [Actinomycetota bacterium]
MQCKERLEAYLRDNGVEFTTHHHPEAFTAQEVAATEHVSGYRLAKVVMVRAGDDLAMTVLPAPARVDLEQLGGVVSGGEPRLASEDEFAPRFPDCEAGAMPPFGNLYEVSVYVDDSLAEQETIVFEAGTHSDTMSLRFEDFKRLVQPRVASFAVHRPP